MPQPEFGGSTGAHCASVAIINTQRLATLTARKDEIEGPLRQQRGAVLYQVALGCRGFKTVGRFMPNEVALLPPVMAALQEFVLQVLILL